MVVPPPDPPLPPLPDPPPPHANTPPPSVKSNASIPSMVRHLRRRNGEPISSMHARVTPPAADKRAPGRFGYAKALLVGAVVVMVRVAVAALVPVMTTELVVPKLSIGSSCAPVGVEVNDALIVTLPVNPEVGVTVMVDVLPVDAPGLTITAVPVKVQPGVRAGPTVTKSLLLHRTIATKGVRLPRACVYRPGEVRAEWWPRCMCSRCAPNSH
jgi:hypothetical protein